MSLDMEYRSVSGIRLPKLGFGTYQLKSQSAIQAVKQALSLGLRHIDTAVIYDNEKEVGQAIKESKIPRDQIFLTTKVWFTDLTKPRIQSSLKSSLNKLQTDYIDLLLIHWPNPKIPLAESLGAMEELKKQGWIRHIGVSNFNCALLKKAKRLCPALLTNQVEYHPLLSQQKLLKTMKDMFLTAYSPLIRGQVNQIQQLLVIAKKYNKTPAQIALRWLINQKNVLVIFKSSHQKRIQENCRIFDFQLRPEDSAKLFRLNKNKYRLIDPPFAPQWDS